MEALLTKGQFNATGYCWVAINLIAMAGYSLYVKWFGLQNKCSANTMSTYNNMLSLPAMLVLVVLHAETFDVIDAFSSLSIWSRAIVLLSCLLGFLLSYFGFIAQDVFSPTAWVMINNLNKIPAIILGVVVFGDSLSSVGLCGLIVCVAGGFLFASESFVKL